MAGERGCEGERAARAPPPARWAEGVPGTLRRRAFPAAAWCERPATEAVCHRFPGRALRSWERRIRAWAKGQFFGQRDGTAARPRPHGSVASPVRGSPADPSFLGSEGADGRQGCRDPVRTRAGPGSHPVHALTALRAPFSPQ